MKKIVTEENYEHVKKMFNTSPKNKIGLIKVKDIKKLMPEKKNWTLQENTPFCIDHYQPRNQY